MAWRPNENLIDGELSNRVPGKVTGWMRFFRRRRQPLRVTFDLAGDFHEDIRGSDIVLKSDAPADKNTSLGEGWHVHGWVRPHATRHRRRHDRRPAARALDRRACSATQVAT